MIIVSVKLLSRDWAVLDAISWNLVLLFAAAHVVSPGQFCTTDAT